VTEIFRGRVRDLRLWKSIVAACAELHEEADFMVGADGITVTFFDPARICLMHVHLDPAFFTDFQPPNTPETFRVGLDALQKVTQRVKVGRNWREPMSDLELVLTQLPRLQSEAIARQQLTCQITTRPLDLRYDLALNLPKIDPDDIEIIPLEDLRFDYTLREGTIAPEVLTEIINAAWVVSDDLEFRINREGITCRANGDLGEFRIHLSNLQIGLKDPDTSDEVVAKYAIQYLRKLFKIAKWAPEVKLIMGTHAPIQFQVPFEIAPEPEADPVQVGIVRAFLAPKVDTVDEDEKKYYGPDYDPDYDRDDDWDEL
jgi:DNA polymerase III sliding clamp (beta) subunit (PCNA family)